MIEKKVQCSVVGRKASRSLTNQTVHTTTSEDMQS